ncbi:sugar ABC transporter permease [Virgisporangium ochraceum]|jgi:multiple sugar transport system permease protein|uniref:ABC transporter permease n=1 Tax=Virgisporangium ochraceum TaxID=65505 RepID=A0A8J4E9U9_9ACTN|nr:sugar ABC transporter permease [Virgisporangium ochraceum]GIJ67645.1 ABC transporter permease [Virgisporangium ochraceum]
MKRAPYLFLSPAIVLFTAFILVPIGYTAYLSFRRVRVEGLGLGADARREVFAGWQNFRDALSDPELGASLLRVLGYGAVVVPVMLGLALLFALLLDTPSARLRRFARVSIFLPFAVPALIGGMLWGFLYLPSVSPFPLGDLDPLGGDLLLFAVANVAVWGGTGFNMMVIYTALRAVPPEIYESARIDGCSEVRLALRIKVPMVLPALVMTGFFSIIATIQVFAEPMILQPLTNAIPSTWAPLMKVHRDAFAIGDHYSAAATSLVLALATLLLSFAFLRSFGRRAFGGDA